MAGLFNLLSGKAQKSSSAGRDVLLEAAEQVSSAKPIKGSEALRGHDAKQELAKPDEKFMVSRSSLLSEVSIRVPDAEEIILAYGLHCLGCGLNSLETVEQGCLGHGMSDDEVDSLVDELNESLEKSRKA
jgi:hybrid cluster-associated redox disulfide protein